MSVQEMIDDLEKIKDKTKEVVFIGKADVDEFIVDIRELYKSRYVLLQGGGQ